MFLGREFELNNLNKLYEKDEFQFVVIYGRRRVGKTTLISEFVRNKPNIFFVSQEYDNAMALEIFSEKVHEFFKLSGLSSFKSFNSAFDFIADRAMNDRIILILDEFPYLANANKSIPSILQNLIDHKMKDSKLFLIICGSSMSFMENGILSAKSPLYGRLTSQMKIEAFGFFESSKFVSNYGFEDKILTYGITGGIPQYLLKFSDKRTIRENVLDEILNKSSYLYEEPRNLIKQELHEPMVYNSIIEAIAKGSSRLNDISTKTGIESDRCSKYIHSLMDLKIIKRETPIGEVEGKKSIYRITDNYFKFWYRFVFNNTELTEQNNGDILYDNLIEPYLSDYIGKEVFENVCMEYLRVQNVSRKLPFIFTKIGRWWGSDPISKTQIEIDILAFHDDNAIFGECKWKNEHFDIAEMNKLIKKAETLKKYSNKTFVLFSKTGFTQAVKDESDKLGNVKLVDLKELFVPK
ncbi:MAG: ATP-binding protein [Oscillospiraceae bacterium]|nr:ATP-binding protein [Oscillospiraceae bacterium]